MLGWRSALSHAVGWLADLRVPGPLRSPVYGTFARWVDADLGQVRLPLSAFPSFTAFFVRRLVDGARPFPADARLLGSPADGRLQAAHTLDDGDALVAAKGRTYSARALLGGAADDVDLRGAGTWTVYLSPRDYHRVHAPDAGRLADVRWIGGTRWSVRPSALERRPGLLAENERCVLRLDGPDGPLLVVLVGALNVGRIRVVGAAPGIDGPPSPARDFERGEDLGRFEMGSTVVVVAPGWRPLDGLEPGAAVLAGTPLGRRA